jgi:hypothetical protein
VSGLRQAIDHITLGDLLRCIVMVSSQACSDTES